MDFSKRLQMLVDSGQISLRVADVCSEMITMAQRKLGRTLTVEKAEGFVTHAALAMERLVRGQPVTGIPEDVLVEVKARPEWRVAQDLAAHAAQRLEVAIPEAEVGFLAAHLCILDEVSEHPSGALPSTTAGDPCSSSIPKETSADGRG